MTAWLTRLALAVALVTPVVATAQTAPAGGAVPASPQTVTPATTPVSGSVAPFDAIARYRALVDRLRGGDLSVDFGELRQAFTETPEYRGRMMVFYQQLWRPLGAADFPAALKAVETVLESNFVEINAHMVASIAHQQLGNPARAAFHRAVADGLLRVIMAKGDGKTPETAWEVIDVSEEYAVMRALNVTLRSQSLQMNPTGPKVDVLSVTDNRTKEERTLHFNVDRSMAAITRPK
jgi:hypothetical protein